MATAVNKLQCIVVTPESTVLDEPVDFVAVPLYDGEAGVLPGRAPLIARLGYGELRTRAADQVHRYYVDGGFLQVQGDVVSVLTARAIPAQAIDPEIAAEQLRAALTQVPTSAQAFAAKERALMQARAQMAIAGRAGRASPTEQSHA